MITYLQIKSTIYYGVHNMWDIILAQKEEKYSKSWDSNTKYEVVEHYLKVESDKDVYFRATSIKIKQKGKLIN